MENKQKLRKQWLSDECVCVCYKSDKELKQIQLSSSDSSEDVEIESSGGISKFFHFALICAPTAERGAKILNTVLSVDSITTSYKYWS